MKALLIINPISGTGKKEGLDRYVTDHLAPAGWEIDVAYTKGHGDATNLAKDAVKKGYEAVLAAGADGTINETAAALRDSGTILGIIPCGSGNGLARHAGIPVGIRESLNVLLQGQPVAIDYMTVNDIPCFCTFGMGFDAAVSEAFAQKKKRGKLTYIKSTFETYQHFEPETYTISVNGGIISEKAFLVAVCNASQYGNNAYIAPHASITDGLLDITLIHQGNPLTTALVGVDLLTGLIDKNTLIETIKADSVTICRHNEGPAHIDGEPITLGKEIRVKCHHKGLNLFMPQDNPDFRPILTPVQAMFADLKIAINNLINPLK